MVLSAHLCQVLQPWHWDGSRFSGPVCLNRPYIVGSLLGPYRQRFSAWRVWYIVPEAFQRSVELPMKENVSGYSRNPCSLNREWDTAFAAKLLTLPTGFFSAEKSEEWMVRSPVWPDDVIASETGSRHQPMNWRDSIWVQTRSRSGRSRSVSTQCLVPYSENKGYANNPRRFLPKCVNISSVWKGQTVLVSWSHLLHDLWSHVIDPPSWKLQFIFPPTNKHIR